MSETNNPVGDILEDAEQKIGIILKQPVRIKYELITVHSSEKVKAAISEIIGIDHNWMYRKVRKYPLIRARQIYFFFMIQNYPVKGSQILAFDFKMDRTSIMHGVQVVKDLLWSKDPDTVNWVEGISKKLNNEI